MPDEIVVPAGGAAAPVAPPPPPAGGAAPADAGAAGGEKPAEGAGGEVKPPPPPPVERVTPKEVLEFRENQRRIAALQQKVEADHASLKDLRELKARLDAVGEDHLARAQVLGLDLEAAVKGYAERGPLDPELLKQRQELADIRKKQEASEAKARQDEENRQRVQMRYVVAEQHGKIKAMLDASGDKFELTRAWSRPEDIFRVADNAVRDGVPVPNSPAEWAALYEKAASLIEAAHEQRISQGADLKKLEALLAKARAAKVAATGAADKPKPAPAATGKDEPKPKPARKLSRKEEEAILIREIDAAMAKGKTA